MALSPVTEKRLEGVTFVVAAARKRDTTKVTTKNLIFLIGKIRQISKTSIRIIFFLDNLYRGYSSFRESTLGSKTQEDDYESFVNTLTNHRCCTHGTKIDLISTEALSEERIKQLMTLITEVSIHIDGRNLTPRGEKTAQMLLSHCKDCFPKVEVFTFTFSDSARSSDSASEEVTKSSVPTS